MDCFDTQTVLKHFNVLLTVQFALTLCIYYKLYTYIFLYIHGIKGYMEMLTLQRCLFIIE